MDWVEIRVGALTPNENVPKGERSPSRTDDFTPSLPESWIQAGYYPRHGFPLTI